MINPRSQYAFIAGEVSPDLHGRSDLAKFDLGLSQALNFYVRYRGGLTTRPGSEMINEIPYFDSKVKCFRFRFAGDDYTLILGEQTMRFVRSGGYVLETAKTVNAVTVGTPGVITTSAVHGYTANDMIFFSGAVNDPKLLGRYFLVGAVPSTTTFELKHMDNTSFVADATVGAGGSVSRVYTVATPYAAEDLDTIDYTRRVADGAHIALFTSLNYKRRRLTFVTETNWTFAEEVVTPTTATPANLTLTPSATGTAGVAFSVAAVVGGIEGIATQPVLNVLTTNYVTTTDYMTVTWDEVPGAEYYNVYRSLVLDVGAEITKGQELGYLGRSYGPQFTDTNIVPDFTKTPPLFNDPFADAPIDVIEVTAPGASYTKAATVSVTDATGTGFEGYPIISGGGEVLAIAIVRRGQNYSAPTVVITDGSGAGATATATVGAASGNNPKTVKIFQQRAVYAGTENFPATLNGTKPGLLNNFDVSSIINSGDSFNLTIDSEDDEAIRHLVALKSGLLTFTGSDITVIRAGEGQALTPLNALAEPEAYRGASDCWPVTIDLDVVFAQEKGTTLNAMQYTDYTNKFTLQDISVLSNHLFGKDKEVIRLAWVPEPNKLIYALREDGVIVTVTYEREQDVFGFGRMETNGLYKDVCAVVEARQDTLYTVVERYIAGAWRMFLERVAKDEFDLAEDAWCVDCGLQYALSYPTGRLTIAAITGNDILVTVNSSVFSSASIGDIIYCGGGKLEIVTFVHPGQVRVNILRDLTAVLHNSTTPKRFPSGEWSRATPVSTLTNLYHLEGETISVLADGDAYINLVVTDGTVTLDQPATKIVAGLPYKCSGKSLPINLSTVNTEGNRKDLVGAAIRVTKTRGLKIGADLNALEEMKDRTDEDWDQALDLREGLDYHSFASPWSEDIFLFFEQTNPLPATILNFVFDLDIGDTQERGKK